jgi:ribosomal protein S18 acetylase RimI-like enzyme
VLDSSFQDATAPAQAVVAPRIHLASPADVPFIVDAIVAESRRGHFGCDCTQPDVLQGLWQQIQTIVSDGATPLPGARNGAGGRAFVVQVGQANAGFAILVEDRPESWRDSVELFAMAVHPAFRGAGLGRHLLTTLVRDAQSAHVYARVAFPSIAMNGLLKSCGFALGARSDHGTVTLEYRRPA